MTDKDIKELQEALSLADMVRTLTRKECADELRAWVNDVQRVDLWDISANDVLKFAETWEKEGE